MTSKNLPNVGREELLFTKTNQVHHRGCGPQASFVQYFRNTRDLINLPQDTPGPIVCRKCGRRLGRKYKRKLKDKEMATFVPCSDGEGRYFRSFELAKSFRLWERKPAPPSDEVPMSGCNCNYCEEARAQMAGESQHRSQYGLVTIGQGSDYFSIFVSISTVSPKITKVRIPKDRFDLADVREAAEAIGKEAEAAGREGTDIAPSRVKRTAVTALARSIGCPLEEVSPYLEVAYVD